MNKKVSVVVRNQDIPKESLLSMNELLNKELGVSAKDIQVITFKEEKNNTSINIRGNIEVIEKSDNRRIVAGYASIAIVDDENQLITTEALKKGLDTLMSDERYANLMLVHKNIQIGNIIEEFGEYKTHVDDEGLFIVAEIRKDLQTANEVWKNILDGEFRGFSIGGEILDAYDECDDEKCVNIVTHLNIFEVSVCNHPINKSSGFVIVSKSKVNCACGKHEPLVIDDVCNKSDNIDDNMSKEDKKRLEDEEEVKKDETTEDKSEEEQVNKDEETQEPIEDEADKSDDEDDAEPSKEEIIEDLKSRIEKLETALTQIGKQEDEEEEFPEEEEDTETEEPEEDEEEDEAIMAESEDTPKSDPEVELPLPESYEKSEDSKESWNEVIVKCIDSINNKMKEFDEYVNREQKVEELELAIKSRDDEIAALKKTIENDLGKVKDRIEVIEKSEDNPKTETTKDEKEKNVKILPKLVKQRGQIYRR